MICPICCQLMVPLTTVFSDEDPEEVWACFNDACHHGLENIRQDWNAEMRQMPLNSQGTLPGYGDVRNSSDSPGQDVLPIS